MNKAKKIKTPNNVNPIRVVLPSPSSEFGSRPLSFVAPFAIASIILSKIAKNTMTRITTPMAPKVPSREPPTKSESSHNN